MTVTSPDRVRHLGLDVARGLALVAMFVAHTAPWPGVWGYRNIADSVTAPLFATLIGAGLYLSASRDPDEPMVPVVTAAVRAAGLIVVGMFLANVNAQVAVVLVHLGMLTVVASLVVRVPGLWPGIVLVAVAVAGPVVAWGRDQVHGILRAEEGTGDLLLNVFVGGANYRVLTMIVWAVVGMWFARHLLGARVRTHAIIAGSSVVVAVLGVLAHRTGRVNFHPYTGYPTEIGYAAVLAVGVMSAGFVLAAYLPAVSDALARSGRATLSVYTAHFIFLGLWVTAWGHEHDDGWITLSLLVVGAIVLPAAWTASLPGRGPLEWVVDAAARRAGRLVELGTDGAGTDSEPGRLRGRQGLAARRAVPDER